MDLAYEPTVLKALAKMDRQAARRLRTRLEEVAAGQMHKAEKLVGRPGHKVRAGDYRAIIVFEDDIIRVLSVGHRRLIYE